jgi:hypothetical protein
MDLQLDFQSHDLVISRYDLQLQNGIDLMRQRYKQSLLFFMGEWYLDVTDGVPYYEEILKKAPDQITVESVLKQAILETPGTTELLSFLVTYTNNIRRYQLDFSTATIFGNITMSEGL